MLDWIKNIFKRNKKKVGAVVEPTKPWPRSSETTKSECQECSKCVSQCPPKPSKHWPKPQPKLTLHERYEAPNQRPNPSPNPPKRTLPPKREGVYFNHPNQQTNNDDNFLLGVVVGAATDSAILGGLASGSILGGVVGDIMNDDCLGDCDSGSSWDSGSSCDCGGSCGD